MSDADCSSGAECMVDTNECVLPGARCKDAFTVQLPNGDVQNCQGHRCIAEGQCASGCSDDSQCAPEYACDSGRCKERPSTGKPDAGTAGTGNANPGGSEDDDSCACRAAGSGAGGSEHIAWVGLGLAAGVVLRRRARNSSTSRAELW
ncbi:MAG TPA: hypothetical protein VK524_30545 [Polyangiaceae bacterium]|nr:hypothetical protein [Polyangiaceae bacterium]